MRNVILGGLAGAVIGGTVASAAMAQDAGAGRGLYDRFCAACHGDSGRGDGVMTGVLTLAPSDLTRLAARAQGAFPLMAVVRRIDGRDPILAHGGEMPLFGPWLDGEGADVALSGPGGQPVMVSRPIADLVAYLRQIQR